MASEGLQGRDERREHERVPARIEIHFGQAEDAARSLHAYSLNVSAGGLCILTQRIYPVGARLHLDLQVDRQTYSLQGVVAWVRGGAVGVRFDGVTPRDRERLAELAASLR
jgi:uncharacterized protein (TIGR02266 family)